MQFHDYATLRTTILRRGASEEFKNRVRRMSATEFRTWTANRQLRFLRASLQAQDGQHDVEATRLSYIVAEQGWVKLDRPFYNVWPIATELTKGVKLDLAFQDFKPPFPSILLRFARGHEPYGLTTALLNWESDVSESGNEGARIQITFNWLGASDRAYLQYQYQRGDCISSCLDKLESDAPTHSQIGGLLIRLVGFIGLLANDTDLITPLVLMKDREKYESENDPDVRKWLEDRAVRRQGRGFDVGHRLEVERMNSPHWRNPHFALFWIGPGRKTPVIKMRRGSVVLRTSMSDVPTGFLGVESADEDNAALVKTPRESISTSRRFDIMQRDLFKCQLCGASKDDGATLHIDHKLPLAKGGSNLDDNLWTLCDACNFGKSDQLLRE